MASLPQSQGMGRRASSYTSFLDVRNPSQQTRGVARKVLSDAGSQVLIKQNTPSGTPTNANARYQQRRATIGAIDTDGSDANSPSHSAHALAIKYRLKLRDVKTILGAFDEKIGKGRDASVGLSRDEFLKILREIFDCGDIEDDILDSAYAAAAGLSGQAIDINRFLKWYVENILTFVNQLNVSAEKHLGNSMYDSLAKKHRCSVAVIDSTKIAFDGFDTNRSGKIEYLEYVRMMHVLLKVADTSRLSEDRLKKYWMEIDVDHNGEISFLEFSSWYLKFFTGGNSDGWDMYFLKSLFKA